MKKVKITTHSNVIAQVPAGVEADVIIHENVMYIAAFSLPAGLTSDETPTKTLKPAKSEAPASEEPAEEKPTRTRGAKSAPAKAPKNDLPSEEEMASMDTADLLAMCEERGIDPDKTKGRNTNKKLRTLLLESSAPASEEAPEEEEESAELDAPAVAELLASLEEETITEKDAVKRLVSGGIDKKEATEFVKEFLDNPELEIDEYAETLFESEEEEEEEKPKSRRGSKSAPAKKSSKKNEPEEVEDLDELKEGDKLTVVCEDGKFDCEVAQVEDGNVVLYFPEDDSEDDLDPDFYTEVYRR